MPVRPVTPMLSARTPAYPAIVVYIVYREYVHQNPGITTLNPEDPRYLRYMEKRLRELYPQRGYAGMMRDAVAEARQNRQLWQQYERELWQYERHMVAFWGTSSALSTSSQCTSGWVDPTAGADASWTDQSEHPVPPDDHLPTVQMEIDSLRLVGSEVDDIRYYESLASGSYTPPGGGGGGGNEPIHMYGLGPDATIDDYIRAAGKGRTPHGGEVGVQVNPVLIGVIAIGVFGTTGGYKIFRATQAGKRAVQQSQLHYSHQSPEDTQHDAFRHIYLSVLLRRYIGAGAAKAITDNHENQGTNTPAAKVMDFHNNDIGRVYRYNSFRGHWLWDRWDEGVWAQKVRNYVNAESTNGEYIPEWDVTPAPTLSEAWAREACVPKERYIFFKR